MCLCVKKLFQLYNFQFLSAFRFVDLWVVGSFFFVSVKIISTVLLHSCAFYKLVVDCVAACIHYI